MKSMKRMTKKGFTLIELLVVIAIIGILSGVVLASLNTARQKARNSQRISDARQVQLALELYYDATGAYPVVASPGGPVPAALVPTYLPVAPTEVVGSQTAYTYEAGGPTPTSYCFGVDLEGTVTAVPRNNKLACNGAGADPDALPVAFTVNDYTVGP